jgi:aliphatic sulfonates family ABC transporter substrate-binding protein
MSDFEQPQVVSQIYYKEYMMNTLFASAGRLIRPFLLAVILLAVSVRAFAGGTKATAPVQSPDGKEQPVKIRLGATATSQVHGQLAIKLGYFKDEGLDVELSVFSYGPPEIEAFTAGELDIGTAGDLPAFSAIGNGVDLVIVGFYNTTSISQGLVVRDVANIKKLSDLKGKRISVAFGSNNHPLLYQYLELGGLTEDDVEIVNLGLNDSVSAIIAGRIDAAVLSEPRITQILEAGGNTLLLTTEGIRSFSGPVIAHSAFLKSYPEQVVKFLRAFNRAGVYANANPDEAAQIVADITGGGKEALKNQITKAEFDLPLTKERIDYFVEGAELAYKYGLLPQRVDVRSRIDDSYLKAAGVQ